MDGNFKGRVFRVQEVIPCKKKLQTIGSCALITPNHLVPNAHVACPKGPQPDLVVNGQRVKALHPISQAGESGFDLVILEAPSKHLHSFQCLLPL